MTPTRTIVTFGAGPGIGNHISAEFASHGFNHVILLARNEQRLSTEDTAFVSKTNPNVKVDTLRLDLANTSSIPTTLQKIDDLTHGEDLEVVFFNAARIKPSGVLDVSVQEIEEDFKTTNVALYTIAQWALPRLQNLKKTNPASKPSLLVTSSFLPREPVPQLLSLSLVKASQRNMVHSFNLTFQESGVHVGLINAGGVVAPENKNLNPKNIAEKAYAFYESGEGLDVDINE
ncbi:short-chain dehydrogenase/reductase-like protein SDR [Karstenula rhodostoma CBS 690.94]|uniref:Short-chain dehydrogenase/reductase-like protein SDR n=1 Tax=Karstenula rhodostoma CBS 690.94 TaxID=1392251 RepID=A0A9P4PM53_9PLEO|nr:short-chain dehydrogenase/reductase-like protein SDR [Karstenula rhodostoma CBS 690.94]